MLCAVFVAMGEIQSPRAINALGRVFGTGNRVANSVTLDATTPAGNESPTELVISAEQLALIRDNSFFRDEETEPWFAMLDFLKNQEEHNSQATTAVTYPQLVDQPDGYRGRWVNIAGTVKDVKQVAPAENARGIEQLYRLIIQPHGGGVWPITIYALEEPTNSLNKSASVSGLFFKNQSYRWQEGLGVTPVILTRCIIIAETPRILGTPTNSEAMSLSTVFVMAGVLSAVLIGLFIYSQRAGQGR